VRCSECYISIEPKTGKKSDWEDDAQGGDVWRYGYGPQIYSLFTDNVVVDYKVPNSIKQCCYCSTSQIAKNLL
jgi:hypothetical protein